MHTLSRFTYLRGTRFLCPAAGEYDLNGTTGAKFVHWNPPVPPPEAVIDRRTGQPQAMVCFATALCPAQEESARSHPEPADQAMRPEPEAEPEHSCSSYVEFVTSEEEGQYSHWSASPQSETAQEGTSQRGKLNRCELCRPWRRPMLEQLANLYRSTDRRIFEELERHLLW